MHTGTDPRGVRTSMATWLNDPALRYCLFYIVGDAIGSQADLAPRQRIRGLGRFRRRFHSVQSPGRHVFLLQILCFIASFPVV